MKKVVIGVLVFLAIIYAYGYYCAREVDKAFSTINKNISKDLKDGDIIFQTSESAQCEAVRLATNSKFSHCGIIFKMDGKSHVLEAVQPVKITPLTDWISHGKNFEYLIKRLKKPNSLDTTKVKNMKDYGFQMLNADYDLYFEWSDEKIYCSELVWKVYKNGAGIEICPFKKLKDFNLSDPKVIKIMKERYGNNIPLEENVVAPSQLADSNILETVVDTYKN
ncbi:YiiX family permuted papain-like enzyme [Flavobacterium terrae]|uniref:Permuted papain-like amidase enzyme, YaeF/YiiX, C92 family n=1 Tax=Flavobacterium terrae TaxID=415425 RepID=A0A1M6GEI2_9FLAO|nr:YiiX family permuted papain-like enzyme [Flavobacterium terrae]SHJ08370.1 Permuted papain-like amidase enzyme, YaeF/YiiX, C92 family [Flavobacterium terrae]